MLPRVWGFVRRVLAPPANAPVWTEANGEAPGSPEFDSMGRGQQGLRNSNASIAPPSPSRSTTPRRSPYRSSHHALPSAASAQHAAPASPQVPLEFLIQQRRGFLPPLSTPTPSTVSLSSRATPAPKEPAAALPAGVPPSPSPSVNISLPPAPVASKPPERCPTPAPRSFARRPTQPEEISIVEVLDSDEEVLVKKEKIEAEEAAKEKERQLELELEREREREREKEKEKEKQKERAALETNVALSEIVNSHGRSSAPSLPDGELPVLANLAPQRKELPAPPPSVPDAESAAAADKEVDEQSSATPNGGADENEEKEVESTAAAVDAVSESQAEARASEADNGVSESEPEESEAPAPISIIVSPPELTMATPGAPAPRRKRAPRLAAPAEEHDLRNGPLEEREFSDQRLVKRRVINSPEQTYVATHLLPPSPLLVPRLRRQKKAAVSAAVPPAPAAAEAPATPAPAAATPARTRKTPARSKTPAQVQKSAKTQPEVPATPVTPAPRMPSGMVLVDEWRLIEQNAAQALDTPRARRTPKPTAAIVRIGSAQSKRKEPPVAKEVSSAKATRTAGSSATPQRRKGKKGA